MFIINRKRDGPLLDTMQKLIYSKEHKTYIVPIYLLPLPLTFNSLFTMQHTTAIFPGKMH